MTVAKGFCIILLSGFAFALGGGAIGFTLAVVLPGYYRAVFSSGREPWFDPMEVGVGRELHRDSFADWLLEQSSSWQRHGTAHGAAPWMSS